jgi:hypothetical protein
LIPHYLADMEKLKIGHQASSSSNVTAASTKKKIEDVLKRVQPHTLASTYTKAYSSLKIKPMIRLNGEILECSSYENLTKMPTNPNQYAKARDEQSLREDVNIDSSASKSHFSKCFKCSGFDPALCLSTIEFLEISLKCSGLNVIKRVCSIKEPPTKSWRLIAETDKKIGLALYEICFGKWKSSSLLALVWTQTLEIVNLCVNISIPESIYCTLERPLKILLDDLDKSYGLHSYAVSATLRGFDRVYWEQDFFHIDFPPLSQKTKDNFLTTTLLDPEVKLYLYTMMSPHTYFYFFDKKDAHRDRLRISSENPHLKIVTDAIQYGMENALIMDIVVWDPSCNPIWSFSKSSSLILDKRCDTSAPDLTVSAAQGKRETYRMEVKDDTNERMIAFIVEKKANDPNKKLLIKTIELSFSIDFINKTFNSNY